MHSTNNIMDYYLKSATKKALLADLREAGFEWYDYDESGAVTGTRDPQRLEVVSKRGVGSCIYLGHLVETPAVYDEDGELVTPAVMTTTFHANVRMRKEHTFATDMGKPSKSQYKWA